MLDTKILQLLHSDIKQQIKIHLAKTFHKSKYCPFCKRFQLIAQSNSNSSNDQDRSLLAANDFFVWQDHKMPNCYSAVDIECHFAYFPLYFGKIIWEPLHNKVLFLQQQESTGSSGQSQSISKSVDDDGGAPPPPPTSSGSTLTVPGASTMIRSLVRSQSSIEHGGSCLDGHQQSKRSRSMIRIEIFFKRYFNRGSVV